MAGTAQILASLLQGYQLPTFAEMGGVGQSPALPQGVSGMYGGAGGGSGASTRFAPQQSALAGAPPQGAQNSLGWASPLDPGGTYGQAKWAPGNGIDVFLRRGATVYAPFDGYVQQDSSNPSPFGPVPGVNIQGQNGYQMSAVHVQPLASGYVRAGQPIGRVDDYGMDMLGPYQGMPDGFQHADLRFGRVGESLGQVQGGSINALQVLGQVGYQGQQIQGQTRGPNGGGGGGMGGFPGMGGGPMGGMGGSPFGGSPMGGMGMGMPPMGGGSGMGGGNPLQMLMQMTGAGGGFGGGGFGMGLPPMMGAYPGQGFGGFGAFGLQQGLVPGTAGVGGGIYGGSGPPGIGALGPVTSSGGSFSGPMPNPFAGFGPQSNPFMSQGPMAPFGSGGFF